MAGEVLNSNFEIQILKFEIQIQFNLLKFGFQITHLKLHFELKSFKTPNWMFNFDCCYDLANDVEHSVGGRASAQAWQICKFHFQNACIQLRHLGFQGLALNDPVFIAVNLALDFLEVLRY